MQTFQTWCNADHAMNVYQRLGGSAATRNAAIPKSLQCSPFCACFSEAWLQCFRKQWSHSEQAAMSPVRCMLFRGLDAVRPRWSHSGGSAFASNAIIPNRRRRRPCDACLPRCSHVPSFRRQRRSLVKRRRDCRRIPWGILYRIPPGVAHRAALRSLVPRHLPLQLVDPHRQASVGDAVLDLQAPGPHHRQRHHR